MDVGVECTEASTTLLDYELEAGDALSTENGSAQCGRLNERGFHVCHFDKRRRWVSIVLKLCGSFAENFRFNRSATRGNGESHKSEQVLPQREDHYHRHHHRHDCDLFQRDNDYLFETP